jgi:hypothetical protein
MKALEVAGTVNEQGQLSIDEPLAVTQASRVRVIILFTENSDEQNEDELDCAIVGFRQGWQDAMTGNTIPVAQLWDRLSCNAIAVLL